MDKLNKARKRAIKEALKQPDDFEKALHLLGYVVVDRQVLKKVCSIAMARVVK